MTQLSIFDAPRGKSRHEDVATAQEAADIVLIRPQEQQIMNLLHCNPHGLTCDEMAQKCQLPLNSISTRMRRMLDMGLVALVEVPNDCGYYCKLTRETRSGRKAQVYKAV